MLVGDKIDRRNGEDKRRNDELISFSPQGEVALLASYCAIIDHFSGFQACLLHDLKNSSYVFSNFP